MNKEQQEKYIATALELNMWIGYFALIGLLAYSTYYFNVFAIGISSACLLAYIMILSYAERFIITINKKQ